MEGGREIRREGLEAKEKKKFSLSHWPQQKPPANNTGFPINKTKFTNNEKIKRIYKDTYLQEHGYMYMLSSCIKFIFSIRLQSLGKL